MPRLFFTKKIEHNVLADAFGNLKSKTDYLNNMAATLNYGANYGKGPHQVAEVRNSSNSLLASFTYDANGNLTSSTDSLAANRSRTLVYNQQMVPTSVSQGSGNSSQFRYDEGNERYFEKHIDGSKTTKIWKLGKLFEQTETWVNGSKTNDVQNHYVGQHGLFKYYPVSTVKSWNFLLQDRLGSVDTVVDANNAVLERHGYDPFGKPRTAGWDADSRHPVTHVSALLANASQRGYTGHDHVDSVGLIHMNGRAYDPEIGRFTGVDPFITGPLNAQALSPYRYVNNNPVMGTDPTGYTPCSIDPEKGRCIPHGTMAQMGMQAMGDDMARNAAVDTVVRDATVSKMLGSVAASNGAKTKTGTISIRQVEDTADVQQEAPGADAGNGERVRLPLDDCRSCRVANDGLLEQRLNGDITAEEHREIQETNAINGVTSLGGEALGIAAGKAIVAIRAAYVAQKLKASLIAELAAKGIKHTPGDIVQIARNADGAIVFLEKGNASAGLTHILARHADDFKNIGVAADDVPSVLFQAIKENNVVGTIGAGRNVRSVYQTTINGAERQIAIGVADNGFVVTAHPLGL